ncbi:MAG: class A beta-lactamase-related serine hydrolase [Cytophagales bacterium]|nr:MAG: class A beta-lactamase-related serine hydrolase [Cytophagales bacterium]
MKNLFFISIIFFNTIHSNFAQTNTYWKKSIDSLLENNFETHLPGVSTAIIHKGKIIYQKNIGVANFETQEPIKPNTNFRVASITKQFTAMAIMILKENNQLDYDHSIRNYLPELPTSYQPVSIRHLLNHTSGAYDYDPLTTDYTYQLNDDEVFNLICQVDTIYFSPNSQFLYSNTGYVLLGKVVERITQAPFAAFVEQKILKPVGMKKSHFYSYQNEINHRAFGYQVTQKDTLINGVLEKYMVEEADQSTTSALSADGCLYTSIEEYALWEASLYTEKLITATTQLDAYTYPYQITYPENPYGFGWFVSFQSEGRVLYHKGETRGFTSFVRRNTQKKYAIVVFTNRMDINPQTIAEQMSQLFVPTIAN